MRMVLSQLLGVWVGLPFWALLWGDGGDAVLPSPSSQPPPSFRSSRQNQRDGAEEAAVAQQVRQSEHLKDNPPSVPLSDA